MEENKNALSDSKAKEKIKTQRGHNTDGTLASENPDFSLWGDGKNPPPYDERDRSRVNPESQGEE